MTKLPGLMLLASLAFALPAEAQLFVPSGAITLDHSPPPTSGCRIIAREVFSVNDGTELVFRFHNAGTNWVSFGLRVTVTGTNFSRAIWPSQGTGPRAAPETDGVVRIPGISPPLPVMLGNPGATVAISGCSRVPGPGERPRNTQ